MERTKPPADQSPARAAAASIAPRNVIRKPSRGLLPSGSTMLNLALSDHFDGGIGAGKVVNIIGDSSAGKTLLCLTMFAEMANDPQFADYRLIYDEPEQANEFGLEALFGSKTAERVEAPYDSDKTGPLSSKTIEQFYVNIMRLVDQGEKFIYVLDSLDALSDAAEYEGAVDLVNKADKLLDKGEDDALEGIALQGTYGMAKPKLMSQILRNIVAGLADTASVLVIISQTRDNINARPGMPTRRRAGGKALQFYCSSVIWLTMVKTLKAGKKGAEEIIGHEVEASVGKNKLTGKLRKVKFSTYDTYGVDDIGSCIDFLTAQGVLTQKSGYINATALGEKFVGKNYTAKQIIEMLESDEAEIKALRELCGETWLEKEQALDLGRKPRFAND